MRRQIGITSHRDIRELKFDVYNALQRLKRAGKVECVSRLWRLVESKPAKEPGEVAFDGFYIGYLVPMTWAKQAAVSRVRWTNVERAVLAAYGVTK